MSIDRRRFFRLAGLGAAGLGTAGLAGVGFSSSQTDAPPKGSQQGSQQGSSEATFALPSRVEPLTAKRWAMVVDLQVCAELEDSEKLAAACHRAHNVPSFENPKDEVKWLWSEHFEEAFPEQSHEYLPEGLHEQSVLVFCNHCDRPPCTKVCPTGATWKRDRDGIVMMDWHRCIGCRYCIAACPYGSRSFNWRDPRPHLEELNPSFPTRTRGVVEKCNFCEERLAQGRPPACVEACEHGGLVFGDLEDPDSPVRELLHRRHALRRRPGLGTQPEVFYLVDGFSQERVKALLGEEPTEALESSGADNS